MSDGVITPPRFAALHYRDFRLLWLGQLVSIIGAQMQMIAVGWHTYQLLRGTSYTFALLGFEMELSGEALGLGTLGLVRVLPVVVFALLGGMLADTRDRRRLMIWAHLAATAIATILAVLTLTDNATITAIYILTAASAAASTFDNPAQQALVPNLVAREHLTNAISLNALIWQIGTIIGPALAGVLVGALSIGVVYAISAVSFTGVIIALLLMKHRGGAAAADTEIGWTALIEGLSFTYRSRIVWSTMLLDFFATLFASARTMLPIIADDVLRVGVEGYGLLATAQPVGAIIAGAALSLRRNLQQQGKVLLINVALYGLATALFGVSTLFALSYMLFGLTGAADTVSMVIRQTIRQIVTPDRLRGRMTSVNMVFFMGGPQLGELRAGLMAAFVGAPHAIMLGGLATVLFTGWVAWRYPHLRAYTSHS